MANEETTFMYYESANSLLRIAFDKKGDPDYCDVYDPKTGEFVRRNEILDDVLNDHETRRITPKEAEAYIERLNGPHHPKVA